MAVNSLTPKEINEEICLINGAVRLLDEATILDTLAEVPEAQPDTFRQLLFDPSLNPTAFLPDCTSALQQRFYAVFPGVQELNLHGVTPVDHKKHEKILRHFTGITSLRISHWDFRKFETDDIKRILHRFRETVRTLEIYECGVNSDVLIFLTSLFPHVDNLSVQPSLNLSDGTYKFELRKPSDRYLVKGPNTPLDSVEFRGSFTFVPLADKHENFIAFVKDHASGINSIHVLLYERSVQLEELFERSESTLLSAGVWFYVEEHAKFINVSSLSRLQNLSIRLLNFKPNDPNWEVLKTVNSLHLKKIEVHSFNGMVNEEDGKDWQDIDSRLCELYDKSPQADIPKLQVSLHPTCVHSEDGWRRFKKYVAKAWPSFHEKGRINFPNDC